MSVHARWQILLLLAWAALLGTGCTARAKLTPPLHPATTPLTTKMLSLTPTPSPNERFAAADRLLKNGQYTEAIAEYQRLLLEVPEAVWAPAMLGLGTAYFQNQDHQQAVEALSCFIKHYPTSPLLSRALFMLAQAYEALGQWASAVEVYKQVLPLESSIEAYLYFRIGDVHGRAGEEAAAVAAYARAAQTEAPNALRLSALENMGDALRMQGRPEEAIAAYSSILDQARQVSYRTNINYKMGLAEHEAGRTASAVQRWLNIIERHANTWAAYASLQALVATSSQLPDDLSMGVVYYHANKYEDALAVLHRYIRADPKGHLGDAHYYAGMSFFHRQEYNKALREFDLLIEAHPLNKLVPQGWLAKARTLAAMNRVEEARRTYRRFVALYPDHRQAEDALWRAAALAKDRAEAQEDCREIARAYPHSARAAEARFREGLCAYATGNWAQAMTVWQQALAHAQASSEKARLLFWLGKAAAKMGQRANSETYWAEAMLADPKIHYGRRAKDQIHEFLWRGICVETLSWPIFPQRRGQREEAEAWLASWLGSASDNLDKLPSRVLEAPAFQRAEALHRVGLYDEAIEEYRTILTSAWEEPNVLYSLALYFDDRELYRLSTSAAERLLQLAPQDQTAPRLLLELAYPTPFADLVFPAAVASRVDPLFFYALMRQESRFDPHAKSYAGAIGLTQVMPATGEWIAKQVGDTEFTVRDLYRPVISVRYGLYYLSTALRTFEDDPFRALVGYNAGLNNAKRWAENIVHFDPDLFYEELPAQEPQTFIRTIYEQHAAYRLLYEAELAAS